MRLILLSLLALSLGFNANAAGKVRDTEPSGTYDCSTIPSLGHPRVMMTAADFKTLRKNIKSAGREGSVLHKLHSNAIARADNALACMDGVEYVLDASGRRLLTQSRKALDQLFSCSYAFRMTGDSRYLAKAIDVMYTVCSFNDWHPSHYLDTGEMALGVAIAYDWLYKELPESLREMACRAMEEYALRTSLDQDFHKARGNWNQVCNAGVMASAIAIYEHNPELAKSVIEKGVRTNAKAIRAIYGPDGNYGEGYGYWAYGTSFQVVIMELLKTAFGSLDMLGDISCFYKTAEYMLFMAGVNGGVFSYADGGDMNEGAQLPMWWFARQAGNPELVMNEKRLLYTDAYSPARAGRLASLLPCIVKDSSLDEYPKSHPLREIWYGGGQVPVAMVHTGWRFDDSDHYVGIKGGRASSGHGHMDAGSFVYDALGVRWSEDYHRPEYAPVENYMKELDASFWSMKQNSLRWDILKMNNMGHSTISVASSDGSVPGKLHPTDHVAGASATIEEVFDSSNRLGVKLDMSGVLGDGVAKAFRTITLEDRNDLVIVDEITAKDTLDAEVLWRMVTEAEVLSVSDEGQMLSRDGRLMRLSTSSSIPSVKVDYARWDYARPAGWAPRKWNDRMKGKIVGYTATVPAGTTVTLTTVLSPVKRKTTYF